MRIPALLLSIAICFSVAPSLPAQDPGAQQDAEAAREKLLKASDELDNIQANSEATKISVEGMKADVGKLQGDVAALQTENAALKQQVADLQAALDEYKAEQVKARQTLINNVADMIAAGKSSGATKPVKKKREAVPSEAMAETPVPTKTSDAPPISPGLAPPPDTAPAPPHTSGPDGPGASTAGETTAPIKPLKGYYHIVASGETLTLIIAAYRDKGVNVTASAIRKANGLTETSVLKTGQKLFIPKPGI